MLIGLHFTFLLSAGALWRDEVNSVNIASLPSLSDMWGHLRYDSFPVLWLATLRAWIRVGPGTADFGIRIMGLVVGLGTVVTLWRNARVFGHSIPLVSLALLGFNSAVVSYGDSIRGYGLGMLTGLLTFGLVWQAVEEPKPKRMVLALSAALVSVHCLYQSTVLVFAACVAGAAVAVRRESWRSAALIAAIGAVCALSLLPYAPTIAGVRGQDFTRRVDMDSQWIWQSVKEAFTSTGGAIHWVWIGLAALAAATTVVFLRRADDGLTARERDATLYCGVAMLAGIPAYVLFLKVVSYASQPWYSIALIALVAACLDTPLALLARTSATRFARLLVVVAVALLVLPAIWMTGRTRKTNVDLIASKVGELAVNGDLVIVNPWYVGITFARYYRGRADWITIPPMSSHAFHSYDLLKEKMMTERAIAPVLGGMRKALQEGHRVFWIGDLFLPKQGEVPTDPPPAPRAPWGWADGPYYHRWGLLAGHLIQSHAKAAEQVDVPIRQTVSAYEDVGLFVFSGWWSGDGEAQ